MSLWSRIANVFRGDRLSREIDEEMQSHIEEAIEQGRDPGGGAAGVRLRRCGSREESRDVAADRVAGFAARRCRVRVAAADEEEGDFGRGDAVAGAGDRRLHGGFPADRRAAAAAVAGVRTRTGCTPSLWQGIGPDGRSATSR